ncbi:MAG: IS5 family transposase [Tepidisphaeraceae bacterium]
MSKLLVPDGLWEIVEPLLPKHPYTPGVGKPRVSDRVCLTGILFVLKTGIPWEDFPQEMGCCGMTLWNRFDEWSRAGVWQKLHEVLLAKLNEAGLLDLNLVAVDSSSVRAGRRRKKTGPSPVDRRKSGSKHHVVVDARGTPLATTLTGANRHDVTQLLPLVEAIPRIKGRVGRPRHKPGLVLGDRGYDSNPHRATLHDRGIATLIARRGEPHGSGLGVLRYVAEQTIALLHQFRRLRTRFDRRADVHESFMSLACSVICWRRWRPFRNHF